MSHLKIQAYNGGVDQLVVFSVLTPWQIKRAAVENKRAASSVRVTNLMQVDIWAECKEERCRILKQKTVHFSETSELASKI